MFLVGEERGEEGNETEVADDVGDEEEYHLNDVDIFYLLQI